MAVDPSWDNFTNKLLPVRRVDRLVVWNDLMKQQAIELHGYDPEGIRVAGTPQWDLYFREGVTISREAFCAQVDADGETAIDPYAAEAPEEFFAVATEYHFSAPSLLAEAMPEVAAHLARFYGPPPAL